MKSIAAIVTLSVICVLLALQSNVQSQESRGATQYEYASVRYMGGNRTSFVWPDGKVDKLTSLSELKRPETADERMFYLTIAMNILAKRGFEPATIPSMSQSPDDIVVRRLVTK